MKKLTETTIEFSLDCMPRQFVVEHNLSEHSGLSIEDALNSWLARTKQFTVKSFCKYVKSKDINFICNPIT